jgi:hypothetical protein
MKTAYYQIKNLSFNHFSDVSRVKIYRNTEHGEQFKI